MRRWIFVLAFFALLFALACGFESVSFLSAEAEQIAFLLVPAVFTVSAIVGLSRIASS
ncbi:MAG: hypothetical protein ACRD2B_17900 [Terriglobia bacterium]